LHSIRYEDIEQDQKKAFNGIQMQLNMIAHTDSIYLV
jgi:hypothetical protein